MARYLRLWLLALLAFLLVALALNFWADPYGLYRPYGDGDWKPHAATQGALVKPYQVLATRPTTLILGNSRAEVGFDPLDPAWPEGMRPVYNLALPGTATPTTRRLFEHVLAAQPPKFLLLGVDFMDFLLPENARAGGDPAITDRLLARGDGQPNTWRWLTQLHDGAATLASLDALAHSLDTLRLRGRPGVAHLTPDGFNPMRDYVEIARNEGYHALFLQKDADYARTNMRQPRNLFVNGTGTSPAFDDVRAILESARARRIDVTVIIYPYHAHFLELLRLTGLWHLYEDWKREMSHLVATAGRGEARLWDFSGYHRFAEEVVPGPDDRLAQVHWYWEAGHFKKELGHEILQRIYAQAVSEPGVVLTPGNVEAEILAQRGAGETYRLSHTQVVKSLEALIP